MYFTNVVGGCIWPTLSISEYNNQNCHFYSRVSFKNPFIFIYHLIQRIRSKQTLKRIRVEYFLVGCLTDKSELQLDPCSCHCSYIRTELRYCKHVSCREIYHYKTVCQAEKPPQPSEPWDSHHHPTAASGQQVWSCDGDEHWSRAKIKKYIPHYKTCKISKLSSKR